MLLISYLITYQCVSPIKKNASDENKATEQKEKKIKNTTRATRAYQQEVTVNT
jgi:hypothetical protein